MDYRSKEKDLKSILPGMGRVISKFAPYIRRQQQFLIAGSFLALFINTVLRLLQPWPLKFIFDRVLIPNAETGSFQLEWGQEIPPMLLLTFLTFLMVAIATLSALVGYLSKLGIALATMRILAEVRCQLFRHLQRLSLTFHHQFKSGDLITRVTADIERIRNVIINSCVPFLTNFLSLIGMVGVMLWLNWELALIAISLFPIFMALVRNIITRIRKAARRHRQSEGVLASTTSETIGAIKVVQALALHEAIEHAFWAENQENLNHSTASLKLSALLNRTIQVLVALLISLVLWRGSQLVLNKVLTPGDLLIFITYIKESFEPPMRKFANHIGQMAKATASAERVVDILEYKPRVRDFSRAKKAHHLLGFIRFVDVSFGYDPSHTVLHNLSFEVEPRQTVAITGSSGSGKSTLISLLLRLYDPISGHIFIDEHDIREYQLESLRRQISVVLQDSLLFAASVRENIAYGKLGATEYEIEQAARLANAHDFILKLPQGYNTILGERGANLSGGQRQRIAIARAAIRQAPIVILDEPTTGLDNASEQAVTAALNHLTQGRTTFLISHNLRAVEHADLILYVEEGRILERGTHKTLLNLGKRYAKLYQLQNSINSSTFQPKDTHAFNT